MTRKPRLHIPNATYHIMLRGNNGQKIFSSNKDRCRLCHFLQKGHEKFDHEILAFCFMTNHIHLAIKVSEIHISKIIHNLASRYSHYYNKQYGRIGHLFQGRFHSVIIGDIGHLRELIRYIHLNPVRANMTQHPEQYSWSSHNTYLQQNPITWVNAKTGLNLFADTLKQALSIYEPFIINGMGDDSSPGVRRDFGTYWHPHP